MQPSVGDALRLSSIEVDVLTALAKGDTARALAVVTDQGLLKMKKDGRLARNRERSELESKLLNMGFQVPWAPEPAD